MTVIRNEVSYDLNDITDLMNYLRRYQSDQIRDVFEQFQSGHPIAFTVFTSVLAANIPLKLE